MTRKRKTEKEVEENTNSSPTTRPLCDLKSKGVIQMELYLSLYTPETFEMSLVSGCI